MKDIQFARLLERFECSRSGYRKVRRGVKKRIARHMQMLKCGNMEDYLRKVENDGETRKECERRMAVSISRFFRDPEVWRFIEKEMFPLFAGKERLRVWSAGCAGGEEVYSFIILWQKFRQGLELPPALEIMGSDINPSCLERGMAGVYPPSSFRETPEDMLSLHFDAKKRGRAYAVRPELKAGIIWERHHLLRDDPPGADFDIVFLRNHVLTYYENRLRKKAFTKILQSLPPSGFLIIGKGEKLPSGTETLTRLAPCVFRNGK